MVSWYYFFSGTISVSECLDREKIDTYHLAVKAEDGGNKVHSSGDSIIIKFLKKEAFRPN